MQQERQAPQRGLLVRHSSGCLSPRVLDFLCFDTPRSVLGGDDDDEELTFYLAAQGSLESYVQQGLAPCPALWVEPSALTGGGSSTLRVLYRLGGTVQHCALPGKPLKLQPVKQAGGGGSSSSRGRDGSTQQPNSSRSASSDQRQRDAATCRAYISGRRHTQLYRLVMGLFPKLEQLDHDLASGTVLLAGGGHIPAEPLFSAPAVRATPLQQGVLLERLDGGGECSCCDSDDETSQQQLLQRQQLTISIDFAHACLVLKDAPGPGATPACLRSVNSLAEALAALHREAGRLGPSLNASPIKPAAPSSGGGGAARRQLQQSPAKPPLLVAHGVDALRLAVVLVQECGCAQLREGLAILSAAAGNPGRCATALGLGAMEALVTAAATVLPSSSMGMSELQPSITVAVTSLLDAAPSSAYAAGRLVSILAAVLQQSCANPLLLCRLLLAVLQRADVRAEAMRQGLASTIADMYVRLSPAAEALAAQLLPCHTAASSGCVPALLAPGSRALQQEQQQRQQQQQQGFGSPLLAGQAENQAAASNGSKRSQVAHMVAAYNALSDSGSDCSPSASRSISPVKGSPTRSPSASARGRFCVPRLALPVCDSPTGAAGGLTRSTRRVLSSTPGGTRSPSPYGSPTRRSGTCDSGLAEPAARAELATLASALGESLMAADLPAIVAHKRQADARLCEAADEVPAELLDALPPTAKKVLEAHRILVTARSLRSVDSSPSRTTDTEPAAAGGAGGARAGSAGRQPQDTDQIKCLLMKALVAALPLLDAAGWLARDPSPVLAADVLGLLGRPLSLQQEQLKAAALEAVLRLSEKPAAQQNDRSSGIDAGAGSPATGTHVLVAAAGKRLDGLVRSGQPWLTSGSGQPEGAGWSELLALLQLLTDYTNAVQQASVATAMVRYCLLGLQSLMGVLQAEGLDVAAWSPPTWQLLHSLVLLLAAACHKCRDAEAGRGLLALILGDHQVAAMLNSAAAHILLQQPATGTTAAMPAAQPLPLRSASLAQRSRVLALQRDLLQLFAALAALVGRQPPCVQQPHHPRDSDSLGRAASRLSFASSAFDDAGPGSSEVAAQGPGQDLLLGLSARRGLTRRHALLFFGFLVSPHAGLAQRILEHDPAAPAMPGRAAVGAGRGLGQSQPPASPLAPPAPGIPASAGQVRLRQGLLELLKAVFAAPGSPFAADKHVTDFYIRFHFIQFLKLYHNPHRDHQALFLCRQHMDLLLALATNKSPHIRHRFHQLSVVDFFVRELSLEFEAKQPARGRMHRLSSGGSILEHRRTSSASTLGGWESGAASPALSLSLKLPTVHEPEQQQQQAPPLPQQQHAGMPADVPLLRLPSRISPAAEAATTSGASSAGPTLLPGVGGTRGLAVPRLNLGLAPLHSPGGESTPSPGNSARHGRPPLPPSARSCRAGTPRLTSRLGRSMSGRLGEGPLSLAAAAAGMPPPVPTVLPSQQPSTLPAIATQPGAAGNSGGIAGLGGGGSGSGGSSVPKVAVPKLGLAGVGRSLAGAAAAATTAAAAGEQQPGLRGAAPAGQERSYSRVHFSPTPPQDTPTDDEDNDNDDDTDSSDSGSSDGDADSHTGDCRRGGSSSPATARGATAGYAHTGGGSSGRPTPPLGLDVPAGFTFTGDLEEDLERLEALEEQDTDEEYDGGAADSETASPTIPAMRSSPFQAGPSPVPPLLGLPRAKAPLPQGLPQGLPRLPVPRLPSLSPLPALGGSRQPGSGGERAAVVPRLNLTQSMHSNFEARNSSAELQMAADAEQAKAQQGRSVLGELERSALGKGKMQAASHRHLQSAMSDAAGAAAADVSYSEERGRRLLYRDEGLHLEVLQLVFTLIFRQDGQLDPTYCDQYPWERKLQNIPFILYHHLNHEDNRPLLPHLLPRLAAHAGQPALRLLRVVCAAFFRPEWYSSRARVSSAVGAYSTVYRACLPTWAGDGSVVLKLVDTPKHIQDRCAQVDFQGEVAILEALAGSPHACQMYDYGVDPAADAMFLVLKDYRCSLRQWRARQPASPAGHLRLYYAIFAEVAAAVGALLERSVVHFDLKCDNCLLEPLPGVSEAEFWSPSSEHPPFRVVLADFGESKAFSEGVDGAATCRARGTDCFKSPEMLLVGGAAHHKEQHGYDRRRRHGAGPASDIWSLGCLLYELVAGKLLFSDNDWLQLVARVTSPTMPLITEERAAAVADMPGMLDLLQFMLVRDARMRPTLADLQARLAAVRSSCRVRLPPHVRGTAVPMSSRGMHSFSLHPSASQLLSPTAYVPSPKSAMPMPLLAALPLSGQLVLGPLALLSSSPQAAAATLKQHPVRRVVLLFGPASGSCVGSTAGGAAGRGRGSAGAACGGGSGDGGRGAASPRAGDESGSSWASSPARSLRYGTDQPAPEYTFGVNPVFSLGAGSASGPASSSCAAACTTARTVGSTPRASLRFGGAAVHPEPEGGVGSSSSAAGGGCRAAAAGAGAGAGPAPGSARQQLLGSGRVHPAPDGGAARAQQRPQLALPLPAAAPAPGSACSLGSGRPAEDRMLLRVLSDPELSAAASSCSAAGVECRLALARPPGNGREQGLQQPLALAQWLAQQVLPLLNGGSGQQLPVLLAVQAGCEAEGAMAAVAHLMQQRQVSMYQAMVAASQWGIDLHLRQQHLLALQHWAAIDSPIPTFGGSGSGSARAAASWRSL